MNMNDPVLNDLARYDREMERAEWWQERTNAIKDYCDIAVNSMGCGSDRDKQILHLGRSIDNLKRALEVATDTLSDVEYEVEKDQWEECYEA